MNIIIVYSTNRIARIDNVSNFGCLGDGIMFWFDKNGLRNFVPATHVLYFGLAEYWYSV